jgi:hypothetical protein
MPRLLRSLSDHPPALVPFLERLRWRYGDYVIDATWQRRNAVWRVVVNGAHVDDLPHIKAINDLLRWAGDDLRAGTFDVSTYRESYGVAVIQVDDGDDRALSLLNRPPT